MHEQEKEHASEEERLHVEHEREEILHRADERVEEELHREHVREEEELHREHEREEDHHRMVEITVDDKKVLIQRGEEAVATIKKPGGRRCRLRPQSGHRWAGGPTGKRWYGLY